MKKNTILFSLSLALLTAAASAADFTSWTHMMGVRFAGYNPPGGATPLTNFPVLVVLSTNISGFNYDDFLSPPNQDLRFTDSTLTNELNYEVESWNVNGSSYVWVQVPALADSNTVIKAYWGKSVQTAPAYTTNGATWTNGYAGVWHLNETGGTAYDSTLNRVTGAPVNGVIQGAVGRAGGAESFDGINDYTTMGDASPLEAMPALTFECWVNPAAMPPTGKWAGSGKEQSYRFLCNPDGSGHFVIATSINGWYRGGTFAGWAVGKLVTDAWSYLAGTYDGSLVRAYANGAFQGQGASSISGSIVNNTYEFRLGNMGQPDPHTNFNGRMDEIRVSGIARSSNWLWACYMNMASNSLFSTNAAIVISTPRPPADFTSWTHRMGLRFAGYNPPGGATPLTDFPVLVVLSTNISGFHYSDFLSSPNQDLRFTDSTLTNELYYEVESWNVNGSSYVWVQVPSLVDSNTVIKAYWGKSGQAAPAYTVNGATWANRYEGVWHMGNTNASGQVPDSTAYARHGANSNATTTASGAIGNGCTFNGSNAFVTIPGYKGITGTASRTIEAWIKTTTNDVTFVSWGSLAAQGQKWVFRNQPLPDGVDGAIRTEINGGNTIGSTPVTNGQWRFVASVLPSLASPYTTNILQYVDGQTEASSTSTPYAINTVTNIDVAIGRDAVSGPTYNRWMLGSMDEVRISSVARSSNWLWATWLSMASNSSFTTNGPIVLSPAPAIQNTGVSNVTPGSATLSGYLNSTGTADTTVFLFWGPTDGGTNAAAWAHTNQFTSPWPAQTGPVSTNITWGVSNILYYFRYCATNANGVSWASPALSFVATPNPPADFSSWSHTMRVRFAGYNPPGGATPLTYFPALVVLSTNISGFNYGDFLSSPNQDLRFTDSTTTNELYYEVDSWNTNGSSYVWVQVPALVDSNTVILAYWGKSGQAAPAYTTSGATWANGYEAVWHMGNTNATGAVPGSTTYGRHGVNSNTTLNASGKIGSTRDFNGSSTSISIPGYKGVTGTASRTIEAWVKVTGSNNAFVTWGANVAGQKWVFRNQFDNGTIGAIRTEAAGGSNVGATDMGDNGWHFVASVLPDLGSPNTTNIALYLDGHSDGSSFNFAIAINTVADSDVSIGRDAISGVDRWLLGSMDEVRISSVARSSNWLWACYMNAASSSTFAVNSPILNQAFPRAVNATAPLGGSTNDLFDFSQGARVFLLPPTITEAAPLISDPRDILGTRRSTVEGVGNTLYATGAVNELRSLYFRTASHIILTNFQLRVASDSPASNFRTISGYALYGSADNITYALIASNAVWVPYNTHPGVTSGAIMISGTVNTPPYQFFILDIRQGSTMGSRIVELDGFGYPAQYAGVVREPIVFNHIQNTTTTNADQDPGYATNLTSSALYAGSEVRQVLGAVGGTEGNGTLIFGDYGIRDNGNLTMGDGGEVVHHLSWNTTRRLNLAGIRFNGTWSDDRHTALIRFSVNNTPSVFLTSSSTVIRMETLIGDTNLLFASPVTGTNFLLELTSANTNGAGVAFGPRITEIDALLLYPEPQGSIFRFR